jgi:hypothetical protein
MNDQLKTDWRLLLLFTCLVLTNSFYLGNLSKDSMQYLAIARDLNLSIFTDPSQVPDYFGVWPLLYPLLIKIIAQPLSLIIMTGIEYFEMSFHIQQAISLNELDWKICVFASKILNLMLLFPLWMILRKWILSEFLLLMVLSPSMILIYAFTWSECCFMLFFTAFAIQFEEIWQEMEIGLSLNSNSNSNLNLNQALNRLILYACLAFLSRYIGVILIFPLLMLAWRLKRSSTTLSTWDFVKLPLIFGSVLILTLGINFNLTGHLTGMDRAPNVSSLGFLLITLLRAIIKEFLVVLPLIFALFFGLYRLKSQDDLFKKPILLYFSAYYLICLFLMRCTQHFDAFSTRLVYPGCFLACIWLLRSLSMPKIRQVIGNYLKPLTWLSMSLSFCWFALVFVYAGVHDASKHQPFFWGISTCTQSLPSELFQKIDPSKPILLAPRKIQLQRSGRYEAYLEHVCQPFQISFLDAPYHKAETIDDFWRRLKQKQSIQKKNIKAIQLDFIGYQSFEDYWQEMSNDQHQYHVSVQDFLKQQFQPNTIRLMTPP